MGVSPTTVECRKPRPSLQLVTGYENLLGAAESSDL